jgi:galactokinase
MQPFQVSAPGRVCLFGEHQDYLSLAVIPSAINMRTTISCRESTSGENSILINANDLDKQLNIDLQEAYDYSDPDLAYFQSVVEVFAKHGHFSSLQPFECDVSSQIPIKSGLSSSAALLVAWVKVVATIAGLRLTSQEIGMYAYEAEHDVMGIPCGMMDQLSSAIGGIIHLQCTMPPVITPLSARLKGLIVADTKIHKSTSQVHGIRVKETRSGLENLKQYIDYDIVETPFEKIEPYLQNLDEVEQKRLIAVFRDRDITVASLALLQQKNLDYQAIGALLNDHQMYLRDYFEVSVEKIDTIIQSAIEAGAIGGKLTGAGLGGCVVILAPGKEDAVCQAVTDVDGEPRRVEVAKGVSN